MAVRTGLEPATSCVTGRHSNQLNYRTEKYLKKVCKFRSPAWNCKLLAYLISTAGIPSHPSETAAMQKVVFLPLP